MIMKHTIMKYIWIWVFLLCTSVFVWGQMDIYDEVSPMAQQPELRQTTYDMQTLPAAFNEQYSLPFAAGQLEDLDGSYSGPRKTPPVIERDDTPPTTPDFTPIGDTPMLFFLLLAGVCAVMTFVRTKRQKL